MALLTAEDVLNKAFSKTKYREGFDQDEVDDFLDEVASTISALTAERDELLQRLASGGGATMAAPAPAAAPTGSLLSAATDPNPPTATTMLAMAQKLHDDYVQAGEEERERILNEAKAKAENIVERADKDAKERMGALEAERADLERRVDELRRFERDYRNHLRNYLENLLGDLEHSAGKGATESLATLAAHAPAQVAPAPQAPPAPVAAPIAAPPAEEPSFVQAPIQQAQPNPAQPGGVPSLGAEAFGAPSGQAYSPYGGPAAAPQPPTGETSAWNY